MSWEENVGQNVRQEVVNQIAESQRQAGKMIWEGREGKDPLAIKHAVLGVCAGIVSTLVHGKFSLQQVQAQGSEQVVWAEFKAITGKYPDEIS